VIHQTIKRIRSASERYKARTRCKLLVLFSTCLLSSCGFLNTKNAYWNQPGSDNTSRAGITFDTPNRPYSNPDTLFILANSGGGSRAAVFSALTMLKLENSSKSINMLDEIDAISSVSGGSLPTAFYAVAKSNNQDSCGPARRNADSRPVWNRTTVLKAMTSNFQGQWFRRWFYPQNVVRFWFTSFDRSDIMAQVFRKKIGNYAFRDICDDKPRIFINATRATSNARPVKLAETNTLRRKPSGCNPQSEQNVGGVFTFIDCEFDNLESSLANYPLANAVVASSAFPAVFNYTTLRNFKTNSAKERRYIHLYDGGSRDNLGLGTVTEIINSSKANYKRIVVLLVDAYLEPKGISAATPDARIGVDFIVDTNFLDSIEILLSTNRDKTIGDLTRTLATVSEKTGTDTFFYHLTFPDLPRESTARDGLGSIKTRFKIEQQEVDLIQQASDELFELNDGACLDALARIIKGESAETIELPTSTSSSCTLNPGRRDK